MIYLSVFVCTLLIFYIFFTYQNWKYLKFSWKNNGFFVPIIPWYGNAYLNIFSGGLDSISSLQFVSKYFGFPTNVWFGPAYHYATIDTAETEIILNHPKCMNKSSVYDKLDFVFGKSIIMIPYELWRPHRKNISKCFNPTILKANVRIFYAQSCQLISELTSIQVPKDLFKYFNKYACTNFFASNSGLDEDSLPQGDRIGDIVIQGQELFKWIYINPWLDSKIWLKIVPSGRKVAKLYDEVKIYANQIIECKKNQGVGYLESTKDACLFDVIVAEMNDHSKGLDAIQQIQFFTGAATDTTGGTLAIASLLLGMHQDIQEIIYREVINIVGDNEITNEDIPNLKYIEAVVYETLRLFPVIPVVTRKCDDDIDLGTKVLPKGSSCIISIFHMHRDPSNWPNPLKFDPTRFLPQNQKNIVPGSFLPFSLGPRDCIGKAQAMIVLKLTLANIVRHFRITSKHKSIEEFSLESCLTLKIVNKVHCQFLPRCK